MVMCTTYLAQGLTFHVCSTSCVHEEEENDKDKYDDDHSDDHLADDDQHMAHDGERAHFSVGNSHVIHPRVYSEFSRGQLSLWGSGRTMMAVPCPPTTSAPSPPLGLL